MFWSNIVIYGVVVNGTVLRMTAGELAQANLNDLESKREMQVNGQ